LESVTETCFLAADMCFSNQYPIACPPPANEAIVAGSVRTKNVRQIPPRRPRPQPPKDAVEVAALADRFLFEHVEQKRKPGTVAFYRHLFEKIIKPELGGNEGRREDLYGV
jgi:hypothetical protein